MIGRTKRRGAADRRKEERTSIGETVTRIETRKRRNTDLTVARNFPVSRSKATRRRRNVLELLHEHSLIEAPLDTFVQSITVDPSSCFDFSICSMSGHCDSNFDGKNLEEIVLVYFSTGTLSVNFVGFSSVVSGKKLGRRRSSPDGYCDKSNIPEVFRPDELWLTAIPAQMNALDRRKLD